MDTMHYAEQAVQRRVELIENVRLARDTYRVRFACPEMAASIVPGQFLMLRLGGVNDPLLARPFAFYDTFDDEAGRPAGLDVVYLVVGRMTARLAASPPGTKLDVWGPLGNGFAPVTDEQLIMVAGGIGQTPFLAMAREALGTRSYGREATPSSPGRVTFCYGARTADYLAGLDDFRATGLDLRISTDDGSAGHHGLVTDVLRDVLDDGSADDRRRIVCCGPERMMEAVAQTAREYCVPCEVSLETPMACGIGICFSCVTRVRDDAGGWDYRRTCVEGPVFDAERIEF